MNCLHAFTALSLPTTALDVTYLYCCKGHYITESEDRLNCFNEINKYGAEVLYYPLH